MGEGTPRALEQSKHSDTRELEGYLSTQALNPLGLRHSGTQALKEHLRNWAHKAVGTWALEGHLGAQALGVTGALYLADCF